MPLPKNRSTSVRRIPKRTPKRGHAVHFVRRVKGKSHSCALCNSRLQAVSSLRGNARRPNRKFGGLLCTACSSRVMVEASRVREGAASLAEVSVSMLPYVKMLNSSRQ